ncbi:hypothetical protein AMTRI_Chr01g111900 [Amborella trichopoda]|uniref:Uncharacterized protein n=1 Tax=Amborella trichopoda TaxID=13333 RepID=U5DE46_AMBTC|nr:uncharacterized protein LOC18448905 isoform X2 [Amborella trichopoda]XP_020532113.1 uncharacterized protein LOC18448905 isoform X2 [Amborella trichopoda]ERN20490.1 hypothetical protein AMTR_s00068p00169540 [Amborella trichopoda]|eukprot:XP_020532112.1 uncharacterized protein LOC18448905 isoform X2 [Amborella trichopoda]
MPHTRLVFVVLDTTTLCLILLLILFGFLCLLYVIYFHSKTLSEGYIQLRSFNAHWVIRVILILFAIFWGLFETSRISLLKTTGWVLPFLSLRWQEKLCELYIVGNLGLTEPILLLILAGLVQGSLWQSRPHRRNRRLIGHTLLFCFPVLILQLYCVIIFPSLCKNLGDDSGNIGAKACKYFTKPYLKEGNIVSCIYPLSATVVLGVFDFLFICYFVHIGVRVISLAINKGLQKRVRFLVFSVVGLLPLRVALLVLSGYSLLGLGLFEVLVMFAFIAMLFLLVAGICVLVYLPVSDSLAVRGLCTVSSIWYLERIMAPMDSLNRNLSSIGSADDSFIVGQQSLLDATESGTSERKAADFHKANLLVPIQNDHTS